MMKSNCFAWLRALGASAFLYLSAFGSVEIQFEEFVLDNGLHVILHQNNDAPVVSTYVLYHVGSKDERADRTGFAHFFEHLMFEGTKNIPRGTMDQLVSAAGGNMNASTSFDRTDYFINLPSNELELALWIESERMLHARINEKGVETQREVVKEERRYRYENQPYGSMKEMLAALAFPGTPYEWTPIGSVQYIDQATIDEFRAFYKQWYLPNNAVLSIAGDIDLEKTRELVERYFGGIPSGPEPERRSFEFLLDRPGQERDVIEPHTPLPAVMHIWPAPPMTHADANALDLVVKILADGKSSRLHRRLVEEEQAAVSSAAFPWLQEKAGLVSVYAMANRGISIERIQSLMEEEVARLVSEGVTEHELQKAKNQVEADIASSFGSMSSRARSLAYYHQWYGNTNLINEELSYYQKVDVATVNRVARTYLKDGSRSAIRYLLPEAQ